MRPPEPPPASARVGEAVGFIRGNPGSRITILLSVMLGLFGNPVFQLTVVFAEDVYEVGPAGLGLRTSALGVGSVLFAVAGALRRVPSVPDFSQRSAASTAHFQLLAGDLIRGRVLAVRHMFYSAAISRGPLARASPPTRGGAVGDDRRRCRPGGRGADDRRLAASSRPRGTRRRPSLMLECQQ
ncbi:hypothetical protein [Micromonospora eburnea]|uniref:hypothetical protein n=1 Tax=Micromonospora eburnea TaxID=227316 RepID=UPI000A577B25|nr:hypothetical protein [Micromonospora eburnea]